MLFSKIFGSKEEGDQIASSVCILQLTYDFEERLIGTAPSLPVISYHITATGLTLDLRQKLTSAFPEVQHSDEANEEYIYLIKTSEGDISASICTPLGRRNSIGVKYETVAKALNATTTLLSYLVHAEYKIVASTLDCSSFSGYITKTHTWTLQKC